MMSRRKRNTYLVVMVAGGIALAVDQFMLSGDALMPQSATAGHSLQSMAVQASRDLSAAIPELPFPRNIPPVKDFSSARNPFLRPGTRTEGNGAPHNLLPKDSASVLSGPVTVSAFVARHKLGGVVIQAGLRIAVLDGTWVKIGQLVDGCSCSEIKDNEVYFDCSDGAAVLHVALPN